jgi:cell division protein FtsW
MKRYVLGLLLSVIAMMVLGIIMLFSTGAFAQDAHGDPSYFVKRQAAWLIVGVIGCCLAARVDYHFWERNWKPIFIVAAVLLVCCYVPHICHKINGSRRWIKLAGFSFQPSELGKLAALSFLCAWLAQHEGATQRFAWGHFKTFFIQGFGIPLLGVGFLMGLIAGEVDLGTTALIGGTTFCLLFIAGTSLLVLVPLVTAAAGGLGYVAMHMTERLGRIMAFCNLEKYKQGAGLQQYEALIALGSGGVEGLGLGCGRQKMQFLPFAHTDFIFPMIGEEMGLRWTLFIIACYVIMIICGIGIALNSKDRFGTLFGFGLTVILALQAAVNIGVTTSLLPNKGLPLPFISYGGSNLFFSLFSIGILLNIYRQGLNEPTAPVVKKRNALLTPRL